MPHSAYAYDTVPYDNNSFAQSHPDCMAVIAALFGANSAPVQHCRVLELGCASGGNLIPLAFTLPDSTFVGLELSWVQASAGQAAIQALGLGNVHIKHMDLMAVDDTLGTFDYILAHGLYSWVPAEVQRRILHICSRHLKPEGIAYVSYNTLPGWHFRGLVRDMMLFHTRDFERPQEQATQARALLGFLAEAVPPQSVLGLLLADEANFLSAQADSYLLHDHLEVHNEPVYFHQFVSRAAEHGLQYLGEVEFHTMLVSNMSPAVCETIRRLTNDIVRTEQFMDFVRSRYFRQTLLCHAGRPLVRQVPHDCLKQFSLGTALAPTGDGDITSSKPAGYALPGNTFTTPSPITKAGLQHMASCWPQTVPFADLVEAAAGLLGRPASGDDADLLALDLQVALDANQITARTFQRPFVTTVSDLPEASRLARFQAQASDRVTNQLHEPRSLAPLDRHLIGLVDGKRSRHQLLDALVAAVESGALAIEQDGPDAILKKSCRKALNASLQWMAGNALLVS